MTRQPSIAKLAEKAAYRPHYLLLALFAFVGFWLNSWAVPLFDLDEGAFTEATREMFERGDFLMTWLNGQPRYDKPILTYWLQAGSVSLFGWSEFALRLPSMLAATAWMLVLYRFTLEVGGTRAQALFAAAVLALSPVPGLIAHAATADALLNLWLALSLLDLWRWLSWPEASRWLLARLYLWMGLGLLTKGPIAAALPVFVALPFALLHRPFAARALKAAFFLPGWGIALAVVAPWAIALSLRDGGDFLRHFLLDHNVGRYSATMESHGGKLWYYATALPLIVLPFAAWLVPALASARRWKTEPLTAYLLVWFGVVFLLFSMSKTQLPHYLLYGCTPLFVLMGLRAEAIQRKWLALLPSLVFLSLLCLLPLILRASLPPARRAYERGLVEAVIAAYSPAYAIGFGLALAFVVVALLHRKFTAQQAALRAGLAVAVAAWCGVLPLLAAGQQVPVQQAAVKARQLGGTVVSYRLTMPSFSVYRGAVTPHRAPIAGELAFTRLDRLDELQRETGLPQLIEFQAGGVALVRVGAVAVETAPPR